MSEGHRHRHLTVKSGGAIAGMLRRVTVARTGDPARAVISHYVWTPDERGGYRMSLLGFLHGLTGWTLHVEDSS